MFLVVRTQRKTVTRISHESRGTQKNYRRATVAVRGDLTSLVIRSGLQWKSGTLDKPFGLLILIPSRVRSEDIKFLNLIA